LWLAAGKTLTPATNLTAGELPVTLQPPNVVIEENLVDNE
jgi:hypothetical protein